MGKTMKMVKERLVSLGIKPTNRNARKYLHSLRKFDRNVKAEANRLNSLVPRYIWRISQWLR